MKFFDEESSMGFVQYGEGHYKNIHVTGVANLKGNVNAETVKIIGIIQIHGHLKAKEIYIKGGIDCLQSIEAEIIKLDVSGNVKVKQMEAMEISIVRKEDNGILNIHQIQCDRLSAEDLTCNEVRAATAEFKKKCRIEHLFYKNQYTQSEETIIQKTEKI